ncbi:MAG: diguanylate cyclase [Synergistota bacterium]|nr:diguanylate cyclase [Synergistota bacterium]
MDRPKLIRLVADGEGALISSSLLVDLDDPYEIPSALINGDYGGLVLDLDLEESALVSMLTEVRKEPATCWLPVLCSSALHGDLVYLTDGVVTSTEEAAGVSTEMRRRVSEIDLDALSQGREYRLLGYLYGRTSDIWPVLRPTSHDLYVYPDADFLGGEGDSARWLRNMRERGLVGNGTLVDRIRRCPSCEGARLNYVDVCPGCGSIDIAAKEFTHCFTCGRVAPTEEFLRGHSLQCPFCSTMLRHLGSDYDHPLESFVCNDCGLRFIEADVVVDCLDCRTRSKPEDLLIDSIHSYRLTEKGRSAAKVGSIDDVYALLDRLNYVVPAYFDQFLDWLIMLNRRYPDEVFSLLGIRFFNIVEMSESIGRQRTSQLMDSLAGRLRQLIRGTDVSTRNGTGILWLLLPRTDREGASILEERILALADEIVVEGVPKPRFCSSLFSVSEDLLEGDTAALVLARLSGDLEGS